MHCQSLNRTIKKYSTTKNTIHLNRRRFFHKQSWILDHTYPPFEKNTIFSLFSILPQIMKISTRKVKKRCDFSHLIWRNKFGWG